MSGYASATVVEIAVITSNTNSMPWCFFQYRDIHLIRQLRDREDSISANFPIFAYTELQIEQIAIDTVYVIQLGMGTLLDEFPGMNNENLVGVHNRR
jgi:hypothetical protein